MAHRSFYRVRANKHVKAAKESRSSKDKAGHLEIAAGYRKLAGGGGGSHKIGKKRKKRSKSGSHRRRKSGYARGKHVRSGLAGSYGKAKRRATALRNLKKAHAARRRGKRGKRGKR